MPTTAPPPLAERARCARSISPASAMHVEHQEAQKFTMTTLPRQRAREAAVAGTPSSTGSDRVAPGAAGLRPAAIAASSARLDPCWLRPKTSNATSAAPTATEIDGTSLRRTRQSLARYDCGQLRRD